MTCDETTALFTERLHGALVPDDERRLEAHLAGCASCRREAEGLAAMWTEMGSADVPVPSERMRVRFHAALAAYDERSAGSLIERFFDGLWPRRPAFQAACAMALLVAGVLIGQRLPARADGEVAALRAEVRTVGLALLDHQSASERLMGVAWSRRGEPEPAVLAALLERVDYDSNLNVRLAAVEALRARLDRPEVVAGLASALPRQDEPLLQIAIADVLLEGGGADAVTAVRVTLDRQDLEPSVREYLSTALQSGDAGNAADVI